MNTIGNYAPWFWLAITIICIVIESLTLNLTTIWFALSGLLLVFISFIPFSIKWQFLIFIVVSLLLLIFTRPIALRHFKFRRTETNVNALIGQKVIISAPISHFQKGAVKINGIEWSASCDDLGAEDTIQPGQECIIKEIRGVTAIVQKVQDSEADTNK